MKSAEEHTARYNPIDLLVEEFSSWQACGLSSVQLSLFFSRGMLQQICPGLRRASFTHIQPG